MILALLSLSGCDGDDLAKNNQFSAENAANPKAELGQRENGYNFDGYSNLPDGYLQLFKPNSDADSGYIEYMKDIDHAYYFLNKRDYRNANQKFSEISAETLLETPNDAAWAGHAESLCKSGNQKIGLEKLENAQCSVDLLSRKRSCEDLDQSKDSAGFPSECYAQYCEAEIIRPNFERHSDLADLGKEWTEKYRNYGVYLQKIRAVCNGS